MILNFIFISISIYIYIYTHTHIYIYVYIYFFPTPSHLGNPGIVERRKCRKADRSLTVSKKHRMRVSEVK